MKKALLLSAAALLLAVSCNRRPVRPAFGTVSVDTLLGNSGAGCRIEYRFATILNAAESPALQAVEQANIRYFFQTGEQTGSVREAIAAAVREIDTIYTADIQPTQSYEISVEAEGSVQDSLLTYVITRSSYTGGAHGIYETEYHTYSLAKGYEITTADLFTEEQAERLDELILRKLCRQYGARNEEELAAQGFFPEQIGATENFRIVPEGIVFCYNPYDIGCYALGAVEVTVSREELDER